jgi:hypothetical protein
VALEMPPDITVLVVLAALLLIFVTDAQTKLQTEFDGFVDKEKVTELQFCSALWVTYNQSSWDNAIAYCNSTTNDTEYDAFTVRDRVIVTTAKVNITVADYATLNDNFTANLRITGYLTSSESVVLVTDRELNRLLVWILTLIVFSITMLTNTCMFCSSSSSSSSSSSESTARIEPDSIVARNKNNVQPTYLEEIDAFIRT